ncbi:MAG: class A beta-lactamase [Myxococcota bacterium]
MTSIAGAEDRFRAIERQAKGRLGIAAWDRRSGRLLSHRGDERFAMCSTFKWILGALVLRRVDAGREHPERPIVFRSSDLVAYSPFTKGRSGSPGVPVAELCRGTIQTSDNTAANLLLTTLGGPEGFTEGLRTLGDMTTRLDDWEPELNANPPGVLRNTSTPNAMLALLKRFLFEDLLADDSRRLLVEWMAGAKTGHDRLRAGLPPGWTLGNKTGTSTQNQSNDVAFALRDPNALLIVSFHHVPDAMEKSAGPRHATVAREAVRALGRA